MAQAIQTPWLNGVEQAARYASVRTSTMRQLIATEQVLSRKKLPDASGHVPRGVLVYAPSIDQLIFAQPSGATSVQQAANSL